MFGKKKMPVILSRNHTYGLVKQLQIQALSEQRRTLKFTSVLSHNLIPTDYFSGYNR